MLNTRFLRGSDGTGNAVLARVNTARSQGATALKVDSVSKWPTDAFIATSGTLDVDGFLDPALGPVTEFRGHITAGDIIIDSYEPGYTDQGHSINQVVILKQTTGWANLVQASLEELQNEDVIRAREAHADFVYSGGLWSALANLNAAMTGLVAYQAGVRGTVAALATRAFAASKDTYVDVLRNTTTGAFTLVYTESANDAAAPPLAANSFRLAKIISNINAVTAVVQYGNDSLGNIIMPLPSQNPCKFSAHRSIAWTSPNNTGADMVFDRELFDTGNCYNPSTGKFTAPFTGYYQFSATVQVQSFVQRAIITWKKNNAVYRRGSDVGANTVQANAAVFVFLVAGDTFGVEFFTSTSVNGIFNVDTGFEGFLVSRS